MTRKSRLEFLEERLGSEFHSRVSHALKANGLENPGPENRRWVSWSQYVDVEFASLIAYSMILIALVFLGNYLITWVILALPLMIFISNIPCYYHTHHENYNETSALGMLIILGMIIAVLWFIPFGVYISVAIYYVLLVCSILWVLFWSIGLPVILIPILVSQIVSRLLSYMGIGVRHD